MNPYACERAAAENSGERAVMIGDERRRQTHTPENGTYLIILLAERERERNETLDERHDSKTLSGS